MRLDVVYSISRKSCENRFFLQKCKVSLEAADHKSDICGNVIYALSYYTIIKYDGQPYPRTWSFKNLLFPLPSVNFVRFCTLLVTLSLFTLCVNLKFKLTKISTYPAWYSAGTVCKGEFDRKPLYSKMSFPEDIFIAGSTTENKVNWENGWSTKFLEFNDNSIILL